MSRVSPFLVVALCGGYFVVLLDVTVVNVALPSVAASLSAQGGTLAWVVDAYAVPLAALLLAAGAVGDRLGHRAVVLVGYAGFGLASVGCALAPAIGVLVAARAVQGTAAALVLPGTLALLSDVARDEAERARLVGLWASVGGAALPAGPVLGGLLVQAAGWRAVFWLGVPVVALAVLPLLRLERDAPRGAARDVDWLGATLAVLVLGSAVTAIIQARVAFAAAALVGAVVLVAVERRVARPLLTVPPLARRPLALACAVAGLMNLCVLGSLFLLTQVLQDLHGLDPLRAGLALLPAMLPLPLLGRPAGRLTARYGPWPVSALGLVVGAAGFGAAAACVAWGGSGGSGALALLLVALVVWGVGIGILTPAVVTAALRALPGAPGVASGASNTARQTGGAVGVAVFGAVAGAAAGAQFAGRTGLLLGAAGAAFALAAAGCALAGRGRGRTCCRGAGAA